jgi:hypothetical protein
LDRRRFDDPWVIVENRQQRPNMRPMEQPVTPASQPIAPQPQQLINFNLLFRMSNMSHLSAVEPNQRPAAPSSSPPPHRLNLIFVQARVVRVTFDNAPNRQLF